MWHEAAHEIQLFAAKSVIYASSEQEGEVEDKCWPWWVSHGEGTASVEVEELEADYAEY